jgi:hypothetical protein
MKQAKETSAPSSPGQPHGKDSKLDPDRGREFRQALWLWCLFFIATVCMNGTVFFLLGYDLHAWTSSVPKAGLLFFVNYGMIFLMAPLILLKGWKEIRQPTVIIPLSVAVFSVTVWPLVPYIATIAIAVLFYLHWRLDLTSLGFRSKGMYGDIAAVVAIGLLNSLEAFLPGAVSSGIVAGVFAAVYRWFANPASTVENLFYFGFVTERFSYRFGKWITPLLIGTMYTLHEMSNPEYWYSGLSFPSVFIGVTFTAVIYLWRSSFPVTWIGDGLGRLLRQAV